MTPKDMQRLVAEVRSVLSQYWPPPYTSVLKWDESKHPRVPGGSGKESGRFTSGGSGTGPAAYKERYDSAVRAYERNRSPQNEEAMNAAKRKVLGLPTLRPIPDVMPNRGQRQRNIARRIAERRGGDAAMARIASADAAEAKAKGPKTHVDVLRARGGTETRQSIAAEVVEMDAQRAKDVHGPYSRARSVTVPGMERGSGDASVASIMDAPMGEGFENRPRGVGIPEPPPKSPDAKVLAKLQEGRPTDSRPLGGGGNANASCIVTLDTGTEAVYKPERGEGWTLPFSNRDIKRFITNREFSLAEREAFAYEVDAALKLGLVPPTLLRETVDETHVEVDTAPKFGEGGGGGDGGYDEEEARRQYDEYREANQDRAYDNVSEEMGKLYQEAQTEHVSDIESRVEEIQEIWDELRENATDLPDREQQVADREHPNLPMGSQASFHRKTLEEDFDPLELLDEAGVDVTSSMSSSETEKVRKLLQAKLDEGYSGPGELDEKAAREHLEYDRFIEDHSDTENKLLDEQFQSFDSWRRENGFGTNDDDYEEGGGSGDANPDAPHPEGGSFQQFKSKARGFGSMSSEDAAKMAVLDYVIGTMDRHGSNIMFENGRAVAIDNGYTMPADPGVDSFEFRSAPVQSWLYSPDSQQLPEPLRKELHDAVHAVDWDALADRHASMSTLERKAFLGRVENMKSALKTPAGLRKLWRSLRTN